MTKPVLSIYKQQMYISACTSAQFDQRPYFSLLRYSIIQIDTISKSTSLSLASAAKEAGLSLTWWQTS